MVETTKWHVRSNGLNYVIMDQNSNIIAEVMDEKHAHLIATTPEKDAKLSKAMADIIKEKVRADEAETLAAYKDETATTFMNQVRRLQKELESLKEVLTRQNKSGAPN